MPLYGVATLSMDIGFTESEKWVVYGTWVCALQGCCSVLGFEAITFWRLWFGIGICQLDVSAEL